MCASPIKRSLLVLCLFFLAFSAHAQQLGFRLEGNRKKAVIPIEVFNNLIVVPIILNDAIPLKFILDTGVRTTVLTQKEYSDLLGLTYAKKYVISGHGRQKSVEAFVTNNVSLRLPGGVYGVGHSMLALQEDYLHLSNYIGADVHGILGYELFSRFIVKIDYHNERLTLMPRERFKKKKKDYPLPMPVEDTKPYINALLQLEHAEPFDVKLLVDTGASNGLLLEPSTHDRISVPEKSIKNIIGRGLGGVITGQTGRIRSLQLGPYRIDDIVAHFPDTSSYPSELIAKKSAYRNGIVGGKIISRFVVTFDFADETIYLRRKRARQARTDYNMSGLIIEAYNYPTRTYEIAYLIPQSPGADAGLHVGDKLVTINGTPTADLTLSHINGLLNAYEGRPIRLEVERAGKRLRVRFKLTRYI